MSLARRNLFQNKVRLLLSAVGVALSVMLILVLGGFLSGVYKQATAYLDNSPGSVVVVQEGIKNFFAASSVLPPGTVKSVRETDGVSRTLGIATQFVIFELHGEKQGAQLVGYEPRVGGGPWELSKGRGVRADDEVVVDRALAKAHDVAVGDELSVGEKDFTVVGISEGTSMWAAGLMFVRKDAAEELMGAPGATSLLLVTPEKGVSPSALRGRLSDVPGTDALLKSAMGNNDEELFARAFGGPLRLMVGISLLVGALVVGLVIYTATVERQKEYGVLKAVGARNRMLYRVVTTQAIIAAGLGSASGVGLAYVASLIIAALRPEFLVAIEVQAAGWALLMGLIMALLGAILPVRTIAKLAPAEVFRR
ncbi:MAG TPA: ABC transporter permease [Rubrobacter sp.]|nr:ABC transporter permease [Rubrobacter sp.]